MPKRTRVLALGIVAQLSACGANSAPAVPTQTTHKAVFELNLPIAAIGFRSPQGQIDGAIDCDTHPNKVAVKAWISVGIFPSVMLTDAGSSWKVNGQTVSKGMALRVDGKPFLVEQPEILAERDTGRVKISGILPWSDALDRAIRNARVIQMGSSNRVISISTAGSGDKLKSVADGCGELTMMAAQAN